MNSTPIQILLIGALIYLIWAIFHHKRKKSLTFTIFIEYVLTAILVLVIVTGVII